MDDGWNQTCCITENCYKNIIYMRIRMKRFNPESKLCSLHDFDLFFPPLCFVPTVHFYAIIPKKVLLLFFLTSRFHKAFYFILAGALFHDVFFLHATELFLKKSFLTLCLHRNCVTWSETGSWQLLVGSVVSEHHFGGVWPVQILTGMALARALIHNFSLSREITAIVATGATEYNCRWLA